MQRGETSKAPGVDLWPSIQQGHDDVGVAHLWGPVDGRVLPLVQLGWNHIDTLTSNDIFTSSLAPWSKNVSPYLDEITTAKQHYLLTPYSGRMFAVFTYLDVMWNVYKRCKAREGINVSLRFEWHSAIDQSAHADKKHTTLSTACFVQQLRIVSFLVSSRSSNGPRWSYMNESEKCSSKFITHVGATILFFQTLSQRVERSLSWWHC